MVDFEELFTTPAFFILNLVGFGAFISMLVILKSMGQSSIMPAWVKITTLISIPVASAIFTIIFAE